MRIRRRMSRTENPLFLLLPAKRYRSLAQIFPELLDRDRDYSTNVGDAFPRRIHRRRTAALIVISSLFTQTIRTDPVRLFLLEIVLRVLPF